MTDSRRANQVRVARRAWIDEDDEHDFAARCAALLATSGPDAVLVATAAARAHELWLPSGLDRIHIATAGPGQCGREMTRTQRPEVAAHRVQLEPFEITMAGGLRVTTLERTWRDLAAYLALPALVAAGDKRATGRHDAR